LEPSAWSPKSAAASSLDTAHAAAFGGRSAGAPGHVGVSGAEDRSRAEQQHSHLVRICRRETGSWKYCVGIRRIAKVRAVAVVFAK
jgi:hypothetical protein